MLGTNQKPRGDAGEALSCKVSMEPYTDTFSVGTGAALPALYAKVSLVVGSAITWAVAYSY